MSHNLKLVSLCGAIICGMWVEAQAAEMITLNVDRSQVMTLSGTPGAVVVGNPAIADVSINGNNLFLHGRLFGQTNLMILDQKGKLMLNYDLSVGNTADTTIGIYKAGMRYSYTCAPDCNAQVQTGDAEGYFTATVQQNQKKLEIGTGSKSAEAQAPAAPQ